MSFSTFKTILFASGSAVICGLTYNYLKKTDLYKKLEKQCESALNEVLFYGVERGAGTKQAGLDNLFCIYYVMVHANRSIDVCMPSLISETITKCLMNVQSKNKVKVRVVIHNSENYEQVLELAGQGIEVKVVNSSESLEHEFILLDACEDMADAVALIGSLDYEVQRVNCNRDHTLITSEKTVVSALRMEFERIWESVECNIEEVVETHHDADNDAVKIVT